MKPRKLCDREIAEIRRWYAPGPNRRRNTMANIARVYEISSATVFDIVNRRGAYADEDA